MRKVTRNTISAFLNRNQITEGNTYSDGDSLRLFNNTIAKWKGGSLFITNAGYETITTKERLNGIGRLNNIRRFSIFQKDYQWFIQFDHSDKPVAWNGEWIEIK